MLHLEKNIRVWLKSQYWQALPYISLLIWILPLLLFSSGNNSLMAHDEGLYAIRARLMFDSNQWVHPWTTPHHKTPGIYWIIAIVYKLFGLNEFSVRLPSMILGTLSIFILYEIGRIILDKKIAWLAATVFCVEFLWLQYCRLGTPDVSMVFLVLSGILFLLKAESYTHDNQNLYNFCCFSSGLCCSLGLLVRSLMIVVPIVALLPYLIYSNRCHRLLNNSYLYLGLIVGLIPTLIWLWLSYLHYGSGSIFQLLDFVFRVSSKERGGNGIIFYMWNVPAKSFPWFFFALFGLFITIRRQQAKYKSILVGLPVILFTEISLVSTRLSHYSLCLFPFIALLAAIGLDTLTQMIISQKNNYQLQGSKKILSANSSIPDYLSYGFGIIGILLLLTGVILLVIGNSEIHKYAAIILAVGAGWLILPIVWIQRHRFQNSHTLGNYWLAGWLIPIWLGLAVAGYNGIFSDYNPEFRKFIQTEPIAQILESSPVNLVDVGGKTGVLVNFYTKNIVQRVDSLQQVSPNSYAWIQSSQITKPPESLIPHRVIGTIKEYSLIQILS
ncbi:MAG: glycosyltransferase family 39 protein [Calothrix sp. C42_A2020_038]|nr:glycosyltransferase family 39 protein [Calothrix sp. C42_A2020_038]